MSGFMTQEQIDAINGGAVHSPATLQQVLAFCRTAIPSERSAIMAALTPNTATRAQRAAATLSQITAGNTVKFLYDAVNYTGQVIRINQTTATVRIIEIHGTPRNRIQVGSQVRVGAKLLSRSL